MKYTWLVEKYLEGELQGEELREFELKILRDPEVAKEVEEIRKLHAFTAEQLGKKFADNLLEDEDPAHTIQDEDLEIDMNNLKITKLSDEDVDFQKFRQKVKSASLEYQVRENRKSKIIFNRKVFWGAAAAIVILFALSLTGIVMTHGNKDLLVIYSEYYQPYPYSNTVRDTEPVTKDLFDLGTEAYVNANFGLALDYFNRVAADSPSYTTAFLFKGICYMETDQYEKAIQSFNQLSGNRILNEYGEWYRGLCYIRLKDRENARNEFEDIAERGGYYSKKARSILKRL